MHATPPGFQGELPTTPVPPFHFARHRALLPRSSALVRKSPPKDSAGEPPICRAPTRVRGLQHLPHLLFPVGQEPTARSHPTTTSSSPFPPPKDPTGELAHVPHSCGFLWQIGTSSSHYCLMSREMTQRSPILVGKPRSIATPMLPLVRSSTLHQFLLARAIVHTPIALEMNQEGEVSPSWIHLLDQDVRKFQHDGSNAGKMPKMLWKVLQELGYKKQPKYYGM
jgi:hypothetical protein